MCFWSALHVRLCRERFVSARVLQQWGSVTDKSDDENSCEKDAPEKTF